MIISRRKYEMDLKEAFEKGRCDADERHWEANRMESIFRRLDELDEKVGKLAAPHQCRCGSTENQKFPKNPFGD